MVKVHTFEYTTNVGQQVRLLGTLCPIVGVLQDRRQHENNTNHG